MDRSGDSLPHIVNLADMRRQAWRRLPRMVFDFIDGGAEDEVTLRRNRRQFEDIALEHRVFVDVQDVDTGVDLFGHRYDLPFGISPTGLAGLAWPGAELLLADAAWGRNIPVCLSSVSSVTLEDVALRNAHPKWFQLYIFKDRQLSRELMERAWNSGYKVLFITADCAVGGNRERDPRNDFTLPLKISARTVLDFLTHPHWLMQVAFCGAPKPVNMVEAALRAAAGQSAQGLVQFMNDQLDPSVEWDTVAEFVRDWPGDVVIKGVLSREDACRSEQVGASGIVVSNHGGRQLDGATSVLRLLPEIRASVSDGFQVFCDGGFRRGADIVKALALGADTILMGRNTLYGVGGAGLSGATKVIDILADELVRTLKLMGVSRVRDISVDQLVRL